jgi:hypothetical protein
MAHLSNNITAIRALLTDQELGQEQELEWQQEQFQLCPMHKELTAPMHRGYVNQAMLSCCRLHWGEGPNGLLWRL